MSRHHAIALESFPTGLRPRILINSLAAVPQYLPESPSCSPEGSESTVFDSDETDQPDKLFIPDEYSTNMVVPGLSPITDAHISDYESKIIIPRHHNTLHMIATSVAYSPTSTHSVDRLLPYPTLIRESKPDLVKLERLRWRLASGFFAYFICGWCEGVTGTVIPYFMAEFHISFMLSSLLYVASTIGFLIGTLLVELITNQLGRFSPTSGHWSWFPKITFFPQFLSAKQPQKLIGYSPSQARLLTVLLSSCLHGMFFIMMGSKGGFWLSFCAYMLAAFAKSILTAALNAYFDSSSKQSLGYAFGFGSLGGVASPLACQTIIAMGIPWTHFYLGSLVLSALNVAFLVITFKPTTTEFLRDRENALTAINRLPKNQDADMEAMLPINMSESDAGDLNDEGKRNNALRRALCSPYQWAVSIFALIYCGCETTTQAFIVTYLLGTRHADPKTVGYVTSGFWGGITIGRFIWGYYTAKLTYTQRKFVIQGCILVGLTMQLLIWFVNSNIQNAFSTSIVGLAYGPVFPASLTLANDILPSDIHMVSMAIISANGTFGSALFPFMAGLISSIKGIHTLTYLTVPLASAIACLWFLFPSRIPLRATIV